MKTTFSLLSFFLLISLFSDAQQIREYEELIPFDSLYICIKDKKYGIINATGKILLQPEYDLIESPLISIDVAMNKGPVYSSSLLRLWKDHKCGIYHFRQGEIIPCRYDNLDIFWDDERNAESSALIQAKYKDTLSLFNCSGIPLIVQPAKTSTYNWDSYYIENFRQYLVISQKTSKQVYLINVKTAKRSKNYDYVSCNEDKIIFCNNKTWGILDQDFNVLRQWKNKKASWAPSDYWKFTDDTIMHAFRTKSNVAEWQCDLLPADNIVVRYDKHDLSKKGLYNYITGKQMPVKYFLISIFEYEGQPLFWACRKPDTYNDEVGINPKWVTDIYDSNFNLLNTLSNLEPPCAVEEFTRELSGSLYQHAENGKTGFANGKGEIIIPAIYDDWRAFMILDETHSTVPMYFLKKDSLFGGFNAEGNQLIPFHYQNFTGLGYFIIASNGDNLFTIMNAKGEIVMDSVENYFSTPYFKPYFTNKDGLKTDSFLGLFVKQNRLFYCTGNEIKPVDENTFTFSKNYLFFCKNLVINRKGEPIDCSKGGVNYSGGIGQSPQEFDEIPWTK